MYGKGLRALSLATTVVLTGAFALVFLLRPERRDQGFIQKIFYVHVPMAIVALGGFIAGGVMAMPTCARARRSGTCVSYVGHSFVPHPRRRRPGDGVRSGRRPLGAHWWVWNEPTLVVVPDHLPALRLLPTACASRSRIRSARRATRRCSRSSPGAFAAAELPGRAPGPGLQPIRASSARPAGASRATCA